MIEVIPILNIFKDKITHFVDELGEELAQQLDKSFMVYTKNWYDKISEIKTFLFQDQKVKFEDIYFPISIKIKGTADVDIESFDKLFENGNFITILGSAGCGKTMLIRHLFLNAINKGFKIPIMIELRKMNTEQLTFTEYVAKQIFNFDLAKSQKIMKRLFNNGDFLFFLDGYDELALSTKQAKTKEIEEFIDMYPENGYILTSRPENDILGLPRFNNYYVEGLDKSQINEFIKRQIAYMDDAKELEKKIIPVVESANRNISAYFKNPLLLSLFIITFRVHPELPQRKTDFYYNVFDTLLVKHDSITKGGGYSHDLASKLDKSKIIKLLEYFSYRTYFKDEYILSTERVYDEFENIKKKVNFDFDIDCLLFDLETSISLFVKDGLDYTFPHRSMQEYFAARLIMNQSEAARTKIYSKNDFKYKNNQNLWSLCLELNPYDFRKNFLLPNLKNVINKLDDAVNAVDKNKERALMDYVINQSELHLSLQGPNASRSYYHNFEDSQFFMFCGLRHGLVNEVIDTILNNKTELMSHMNISMDDTLKIPRYAMHLAEEKGKFVPFLIKYGLPKRLMNIYMAMKVMVNNMDRELNTEENANDALLDI